MPHAGKLLRVIGFIIAMPLVAGLSSCESVVWSRSRLTSILNSLTYQQVGPYTTGNLAISGDIYIVGMVSISPEVLDVPGECKNREDCRHRVGFEDHYGSDDISFLSDSLVAFSNVRVRFRAVLRDTHPGEFNLTPMVYVMPPSNHECDDLEMRCAVDDICYGGWGSYCKYCLALNQEECVCRNEDGLFADGTQCWVFISADVRLMGACQDGTCVVESGSASQAP